MTSKTHKREKKRGGICVSFFSGRKDHGISGETRSLPFVRIDRDDDEDDDRCFPEGQEEREMLTSMKHDGSLSGLVPPPFEPFSLLAYILSL